MKKCPFCAEQIEDDTATTCPFCRSTLNDPEPVRSASPPPSTWAYGPPASTPEAAPRQKAIRPWMFVVGAVLVVGVVWLIALLLGRSPEVPAAAQPTTGPAELAPGWTLANEAEDGFSIGLPQNWEESDFDVGDAIRFQAIDGSNDVASLPFVPNVNIVAEELPVELSLDDYVQANLTQLEVQLEGVVDLAHERVTLPAGPAEQVTYRFDIGAGEGEQFEVSVVQFILLRDQTGYIFTFETAPAQATEYRPTFEDMAKSFRFTD